MIVLDFLSAAWPYIIAVLFVILLISCLAKSPKICPHCKKPEVYAPCGTGLCKRCCSDCYNLQTKPCKYIHGCRDCRWYRYPWETEPCIFCENGSEWEESNLEGQDLG